MCHWSMFLSQNRMIMDRVIKFYSVVDEYGEFSNFALYPITLDKKVWPTTEHYFQAMKFVDAKNRSDIRKTKTPMDAARKGRDRKRKLRRDWESAKVGVMKKAVYAKFTQYDELISLLVSTGESTLIESATNDKFWGDGGDGSGRNMLGKVLMSVREELMR